MNGNVHYFNDNKREIDFILVCNRQDLSSDEYDSTYISNFFFNLEANGLEFEMELGVIYTELVFFKVHGPQDVLIRYANAWNIPLDFQIKKHRTEPSVNWNFMATETTQPNPHSPIFQRAQSTLSHKQPTTLTMTERAMVVHALLIRAQFEDNEYGLPKLLEIGTIIAAYPLHAGTDKWSNNGPLNDRQLLGRYWANLKVWYKQQPLNIVEKYYGPEVAFYFAFYGFHTKMLIPASIFGVLCFLFGFVSDSVINKRVIDEACNNNVTLCPRFFFGKNRDVRKLTDFCLHTKLTFLFDNTATGIMALFMAIWATIFMELWKRKHLLLKDRWNIQIIDHDLSWRRAFEENTRYKKVCPLTGRLEPYNPKWKIAISYSLSCIICFLMIMIVIVAVIFTIFLRLTVERWSAILAMVVAATVGVVFIKTFGLFYNKIALWLTNYENPRNQTEFDNSYIYKLFLLSFFNNYSNLTYTAFFKGRYYSHPGAKNEAFLTTLMRTDFCHPAGCIMGLCINLGFIMLFKRLAGNIFILCRPQVNLVCKKLMYYGRRVYEESAQWEKDFGLEELGRNFLVREYMELVMQYGLVTFYVAAFPLAPLCALINNLIELRITANKLLRYCRRPIPDRVRGLQSWNGLIQVMTFISFATNAFLVAFTSENVRRYIYKFEQDYTLKGYINSTLSEFNTANYNIIIDTTNITCYYRGNRHPPNHPNKYKLTAYYWYELCIRFIVAVIFEHLVITVTGILAYVIPDVPYQLKKKLSYHNFKIKEERIKEVDIMFRAKQGSKPKFVLPKL